MSRTINDVTLVGYVGGDPDIRSIRVDKGSEKIDVKVATLTLATGGEKYKRGDGTEVETPTEWHTIVAWRGLASLVEKAQIKKGSKLFVSGEIHTRVYEKDGNKVYRTDITADDIVLCGERPTQKAEYTAADIPPEPPKDNLFPDEPPF